MTATALFTLGSLVLGGTRARVHLVRNRRNLSCFVCLQIGPWVGKNKSKQRHRQENIQGQAHQTQNQTPNAASKRKQDQNKHPLEQPCHGTFSLVTGIYQTRTNFLEVLHQVVFLCHFKGKLISLVAVDAVEFHHFGKEPLAFGVEDCKTRVNFPCLDFEITNFY